MDKLYFANPLFKGFCEKRTCKLRNVGYIILFSYFCCNLQHFPAFLFRILYRYRWEYSWFQVICGHRNQYYTPVLATWVIRSKTSPSRRRKIFFPCLQTEEGGCTIRRHQQRTHARSTTLSHDGEASFMAGVVTHLQRLKDGCLDALSARFTCWTKPFGTSSLLATLTDLGKSKSQLIAENALLRQQLIVLRRQVKRPPITRTDRILLVLLARLVRTWQQALVIVQPDTLLRWHRELFRMYWKRKSKTHTHKQKVAPETIALIRQMARENRLWGAKESSRNNIAK